MLAVAIAFLSGRLAATGERHEVFVVITGDSCLNANFSEVMKLSIKCAAKVLLTFQRETTTRKPSADDRRGGVNWLLLAPRQRTVPFKG